jgi:hypothetical protein
MAANDSLRETLLNGLRGVFQAAAAPAPQQTPAEAAAAAAVTAAARALAHTQVRALLHAQRPNEATLCKCPWLHARPLSFFRRLTRQR